MTLVGESTRISHMCSIIRGWSTLATIIHMVFSVRWYVYVTMISFRVTLLMDK